MVDGLLSPEDEFIADYASEGLLQYQNPNFRPFTFLPIGSDASLPYPERLSTYRPAVPSAVTGAIESLKIPAQAYKGELGAFSLDNEKFMDATQRFAMDFGMIPAVRGMVRPPSPNTLSMSGGGQGVARNVREIDPMGFYSEALEQAKMLPMKSGTGEQFRSMLLKRGVKPDELKFTPELESLLSQPRVTQEELVGLLQANRVRPYQTQLLGNDPEFEGMNFPDRPVTLEPDIAYGADYIPERARELVDDPVGAEMIFDSYGRQGRDIDEFNSILKTIDEDGFESLSPSLQDELMGYAEQQALEEYSYSPVQRLTDPDTGYEIVGGDDLGWSIRDPNGEFVNTDYIGSLAEARIQAETHAIDEGLIGYGGGETRFSEYTEDGGIDYRERLIQIEGFTGSTGDDFTYGSHFDEPNVAVHARTKTRKIDGEDTLYVEELQSDWGQQGRQLGFKPDEETLGKMSYQLSRDLEAAAEARNSAATELREATEKFGDGLADLITKKTGQKATYDKSQGIIEFVVPPTSEYTLTPQSKIIYSPNQMKSMFLQEKPIVFRDDVMEKMDVFFTFDEFKDITTKGANDLSVKYDNANTAHKKAYNELEALDDMPLQAPFVTGSDKFTELGIKSLLKEAVDQGSSYLSFSSGDVQFGRWREEGLVDYYDKIIPKAAKKIAKRLDPDAFVGIKNVEGVDDLGGNKGTGRLVIEITPKMKESIKGGQALFSTPSIPTSGILSVEEDKKMQEKARRMGGLLL